MGRPPMSLAEAETIGQQLLKAAKVSSLAELRELPADQVRKAEKSLGPGLLRFAPVIDGDLIPHDPYNNAVGSYADTPILAGMNADASFSLPPEDLPALRAELRAMYAGMTDQLDALYSTQATSDPRSTAKEIRRDRGLASTWLWVAGRAQSSRQPIYLYLFAHVEPGTEQWGAFHTSEVPYALGNLSVPTARVFSDKDKRVSDLMLGYWENFVKTGNPNKSGLPLWAEFDIDNPLMMRLDSNPRMQSMLPSHKRRFYEQFITRGGQLSLF
ncbi:carboxylesterase family protein [Pseudomonas syringae pv. syringae]|nr:carboxylesterase family protein [Pseudomonas syringae]MCH5537549.1 carboxylesterase family protein [Pseudomonas syringae pv. syringae]MCH5577980.1 carboxylesterase family protein [Pseudomonas syringae pv. syringae]MCH5669387.1 carboxylesterase family protein [Pseudomonas syringae pv. syringae]SOP99576.1 hypothetical protein CFBP4215_02643 [Pseudomonas syringae pv. syringae]